ncbi:O-antigen ligase C-terminal domain-containing protein [Pseudomonas sp. JM0905a]|uniref:PglL family O-oligosaccharyltransferase n=1 Tax=Pseudomonas sp. JM0905a TaxID=2772484 RepID=UPI0016896178|nr:O-antigen ligase family protein [Pseudomonas sp. JM0905a]MBD2835772.1 O-antigen ligase C-terminal domain-containing protein [Pseudomonas sp. JM0905a]
MGIYFVGPAFFFSLLLLFVSFVVPNHYHPWATAYNEFAAFLALFLLGVALAQRKLFLTRSSLFFILLSAVPLFQYAFGLVIYFGDALLAFSYIFGFSVSLVFGYELRRSWGQERVWVFGAAVMVLCSVVSVWIALKQWLGLPGGIWMANLPPGARPFANLAQPNIFSTLLCLGLAGVLYLFESRQLGKVASSVLACFLLFGVALAQSRTFWLGAAFVVVWWAWKGRSVVLRLSVKFIVAWITIYVFMLLAIPALSRVLEIDVQSVSERMLYFHRLELWWQLWGAVIDGPLWGYGWGQVGAAQAAISLSRPVSIVVAHSHNIVLDVLIWCGPVLGGGVVLVVATWILRIFWRVATVEGVIAGAMIGFLLIHGMLEFPLEYAFFLLPMGLMIGLIEADLGAPKIFYLSRQLQLFVMILAVGLFSWLWREYRVIEEDFRLMRFEMTNIGTIKASAIAPDVVLLNQLREFIRFNRTSLDENFTDASLAEARKVSRRYPYSSTMLGYAMSLALNGHVVEARDELSRLRALHGESSYRDALKRLDLMAQKYPELASLAAP